MGSRAAVSHLLRSLVQIFLQPSQIFCICKLLQNQIMPLQNLFVEVLTSRLWRYDPIWDLGFTKAINIKWDHVDKWKSYVNGVFLKILNTGLYTGKYLNKWKRPQKKIILLTPRFWIPDCKIMRKKNFVVYPWLINAHTYTGGFLCSWYHLSLSPSITVL